jgi:small ligand-binding sensory domain FIST
MPPLSYPRPLRVLGQNTTAGRSGSSTLGTGLAGGDDAVPALAAAAVQQALQRAGSDCANSVLLLLSPDFSRQAQAAVSAASRVANCVQVTGACVPGVFTEVDWLIDRPAAAAMVLCGDFGAGPAQADETVVSLAQPEAASPSWLAATARRVGGISTDSGAQRPGRVWSHGKICSEGECSFSLNGTVSRTGVSRGVRVLAPPLIAEVRGYELLGLGGDPALSVLRQQLPEIYRQQSLPLHLFHAAVLDDDVAGDFEIAVAEGRFTLVPVLSMNAESATITLAGRIGDGARVFWTLRQPAAAEQDMSAMLADIACDRSKDPRFALMFSCMGRGPYFYGGVDRDLELVRQRFPGMPLLGAYCAGEIAPLRRGNALLHNSVVLTLFDDPGRVQSDA